ncbi:putative heterokaryon incompatibility protein [Seiridium unicorne]|uniref:Heterokaryon incompatibility protein n=1 Tax=Seiridium unicorne TaxID=138068 RepID=A0ABR2V1J5_9PEZI
MVPQLETILNVSYTKARWQVLLPVYTAVFIFVLTKVLLKLLKSLLHVIRIVVMWRLLILYSRIRLWYTRRPRFMLCQSCWDSRRIHRNAASTDPVLIEMMQSPLLVLFIAPLALIFLEGDEADGTALVEPANCELCQINKAAQITFEAAKYRTGGSSDSGNLEDSRFRVFTRPGQDLSRLGFGQSASIASHSDSSECFGKIQEWIQECSTKHLACRKPSGSRGRNSPGPKRLVDTGALDDEISPRLIEWPLDPNQPVEYCALSYCWGQDPSLFFTTTLDTYDERLKGFQMEQIPRTIRDAVKITRRAGCRYLWVDAICIIERDKLDREAESCRMHHIHGNAYLVIAATENSSPGDGIFASRPPVGNFEFDHLGKSYQLSVMEHVDHSPWRQYKRTVDTQPIPRQPSLHTRAWTYQERLLATRIIHYTANELVWECSSGCHCEYRQRQHYDPANQDERGVEIGHRALQCENLTVQSDKLTALAGLARRFSTPSMGKYLAGIWYSQLPDALAWRIQLPKKPGQYRAPSWSWASLDGEVMGIGSAFRTEGANCIKALDAGCTPAGEDPFGAVSDGYILLQGKFAPLDPDKGTWALKIKSFGLSLILKRSVRVDGAWKRIDAEHVNNDVFLDRQNSIVRIV